MSADQHIHVKTEDVDEHDLRDVHAWFAPYKDKEAALERMEATPQIWVGEVSWLKASFTEEPEGYIPPLVQKIAELIPNDRFTPITQELIEEVEKYAGTPNATGYRVEDVSKIAAFLREHIGREVFTMSW